MGKRDISPPCLENGLSKRLTPRSDLNAHARRFSCGQRTLLADTMNPERSSPVSHRAFIALGSNVGDRIEMIELACLELDRANIKVKRTSSLFETEPMYVLNQAPFMNGVCEVSVYLKL